MFAKNKINELASLLALPFHTSRRKKEQWDAPKRLEELRVARLQRVLATARETAYYRDVLHDGPFDQLPLLDRKIIAARGIESFLTRPREGLLSVTTSGSTGEPGVFLRSPLEEAEFSARWWRVYASYGGTLRDPLLNVGRSNPKPRRGAVSALRKLGVLPRIENVSVSSPIADAVRTIQGFRPTFITGYANSIERIADHIVTHGIEVNSPKAVICGAMDVTDHCKRLVREAFKAPAVNVYATNEFGVIAWECPEQRDVLHLNEDMLILEILGRDGREVPAGASGEVVLTSLTLGSMPLIRYRTGDIAARIPTPCPCGRGLGLMTAVQGRSSHCITGPSGEQITGPLMAGAFGASRAYEWVRRFQVQEAPGRVLRILVVPKADAHPADQARLLAEIERTIGKAFELRLEITDELSLAPNGKFQFVIPAAAA